MFVVSINFVAMVRFKLNFNFAHYMRVYGIIYILLLYI